MPTIPAELNIRRARDADLAELARLHFASFPAIEGTLEERAARIRDNELLPLEDNWICERQGRVIGLFGLYGLKVFFFGRAVSTGGITYVSVAPEARRQRIAHWMMVKAMQIMEHNRTPLSILHPFDHGFYRRLGWGPVGHVRNYRFRPGALPAFPERMAVAPVRTEVEREAVMACYRDFAMRHNGLLQRPEQHWQEVVFTRRLVFGWYANDGTVEGYLTLTYEPLPAGISLTGVDVRVVDFVWTSARSLRGLIGFLAAQSDQARAVVFADQANLPLDDLQASPIMEGGRQTWHGGAETAVAGSTLMGRIVNLKQALLTTGAPEGSEGRFNLLIKDEFCPSNADLLAVSCSGGKIEFPKTPATVPVLKADIATLSSLFWGALELRGALDLGMAEVDGDGDRSIVEQFFARPKPINYDYF
ncbi:MAG: GNAT family N-acetyltransferase [Calditrichaeota bacterium]|nr:GNAT family N-acetyltransferase [Calditrichota bacterium]